MLRYIGSIRGVAAHGDVYIATTGDDGRVIVWDKATGESVSSSSHGDVVNNCAFSRDGRYVVSSSDDWTARLWSVPDLSLKSVLAGHGDDVTISAFHPVDELIATPPATISYASTTSTRDWWPNSVLAAWSVMWCGSIGQKTAGSWSR
jgi:toxoflavin biosynthesis protein ToxC